jgi:hypothetical protein
MPKLVRLLLAPLLLLAAPSPPSFAADSSGLRVCEGRYALCTTATCQAIPGDEGAVACACDVKDGFSAAGSACKAEVTTADGTELQSRYYPVKAYAACSNDRVWANCFDARCTVDKDDPARATCTCTIARDQGPYVVITDTYTDATCTTDIWSSATVDSLLEVTTFLESSPSLQPYELKRLNPAE